MNKQSLKLAIIQQIIVCEDEKVLNALKDMLANFVSPGEAATNDELLAALLGEQRTSSTSASEQDIEDIQKSIDEIFG